MTVLKTFGLAVSVAALAVLSVSSDVPAQSRSGAEAPAKSGATRGKVRGFERRIGGYSYQYNDAITDFRDDRLSDDPSIVRSDNVFNGGFWFDSTSGAPTRDQSPYP